MDKWIKYRKLIGCILNIVPIGASFYYCYHVSMYYDLSMDGYLTSRTLSFVVGVLLTFLLIDRVFDSR